MTKMKNAKRKEDIRTVSTRRLIEDTVLSMMKKKSFQQITVTEICKAASINRGTFYLHYKDIYDVLDHILEDMTRNNLNEPSGGRDDHSETQAVLFPFWEQIHTNDRYQVLFLDVFTSGKLVEKMEQNKEKYITWLMNHSHLDYQNAEAIFYFQVSGCLTVNRMTLVNNNQNWREIQVKIDEFVEAGIDHFLIRDNRDEYIASWKNRSLWKE